MKIVYEHSHLNGKEYLQVHFPAELQEIVDVISCVNADVWKKSSEKNKNEMAKRNGLQYAEVYDQKTINQQFKEEFRKCGWDRKYHNYFATPDERVAREIMGLPPTQAKEIIQSNQLIPYKRSNETDFMKNKIAVEVQFGKYSFVAYDFFVKHMAFFISGDINVGVEIIPTDKMLKDIDSGPANYEGEIFNLYRQGRSTPAVPPSAKTSVAEVPA
jgi:hypothetical protein